MEEEEEEGLHCSLLKKPQRQIYFNVYIKQITTASSLVLQNKCVNPLCYSLKTNYIIIFMIIFLQVYFTHYFENTTGMFI